MMMMVGITKLVGQDSDRYSGDFGKMMVSDGLTEELSSWKGQSSGTGGEGSAVSLIGIN